MDKVTQAEYKLSGICLSCGELSDHNEYCFYNNYSELLSAWAATHATLTLVYKNKPVHMKNIRQPLGGSWIGCLNNDPYGSEYGSWDNIVCLDHFKEIMNLYKDSKQFKWEIRG